VPDPATLLLFAVTSLALLAVPGPAVLYVVARSICEGRRAGIVSVLGVETGTFAYAVAAALGLTGLVAASEVGFTIVRYLGAAYLVLLGIRTLRDRRAPREASRAPEHRLFLRGLVVQLLNPKIAVFFLAFLPQFVDAGAGPVAPQILLLGLIFTALAILSDGAYAILAGTLGARLRGGRRLATVSGTILVGLGVSAAVSGSSHAQPR
jgi:threonine/homoserine/homoserine lactone efflux protein